MNKLITVLIPVFNEQDNINKLYEKLTDVLKNEQYQYEFIFTDNHSTDSTYIELVKLSDKDNRVKIIRFNRNYGFQKSILAGYRASSGDGVVQIDCDLQDPPELIVDFINLWEKGHDVIVGVRRKRQENILLNTLRKTYYFILSNLSDDSITRDAGDFRFIDRSVLSKVLTLNLHEPYLRGLTSAFAKNEASVMYNRNKRLEGKSKFPILKLLGLASNGIFTMSTFPLKMAGHISLFVSMLTILLSLYYLVMALIFGGDWPDGFATLVLLLLFSISLNAALLSIIGKYIGQVYLQQQNRPLVVIEKCINFDLDKINDVENMNEN